MSAETVKVGKFEYEPKVLNGLTEPYAKRYGYKKLFKYQESKGWKFEAETNDYNPVSGPEELERELFLGLSGKMLAIFASDKRGVITSVEELLNLAERDEKGFTALYDAATQANPTLKETESEGEEANDPN